MRQDSSWHLRRPPPLAAVAACVEGKDIHWSGANRRLIEGDHWPVEANSVALNWEFSVHIRLN